MTENANLCSASWGEMTENANLCKAQCVLRNEMTRASLLCVNSRTAYVKIDRLIYPPANRWEGATQNLRILHQLNKIPTQHIYKN